MGTLACTLAFMLGGAESPIKSDEEVVFYPTYARQLEDSSWRLLIDGAIYEPERSSLRRAAALALLRRLLGLTPGESQSEIFEQRARAFLVDNERGKTISVRLGGKVYEAGASGANGHFTATLELDAATVERLRRAEADAAGWLGFQAVTRPADRRTFAGRVQLVGPVGRSVISDVDDTIKISHVQDRKALLAHTFLRPFEPVPGMAAAYRRWAEAGATFHYVSASPWQLYGPLEEFRRAEGFPAGSFHMKRFRLKDASALTLLGPQEQYKTEVIQRILADFPRRRFTLVGDSGEQDPEIYAAIARNHPAQIERILIRNAGGKGAEPARFQKAFEGVPVERWRVFERAEQLPQQL